MVAVAAVAGLAMVAFMMVLEVVGLGRVMVVVVVDPGDAGCTS